MEKRLDKLFAKVFNLIKHLRKFHSSFLIQKEFAKIHDKIQV
jgi:hypothetical protein